jgi:hypothetical protein
LRTSNDAYSPSATEINTTPYVTIRLIFFILPLHAAKNRENPIFARLKPCNRIDMVKASVVKQFSQILEIDKIVKINKVKILSMFHINAVTKFKS